MTGTRFNRIRARSDYNIRTVHWIWSGDGIEQSYFGWGSFTDHATIRDWVGPRKPNQVKPVWHQSVKYTRFSDFSTFPGDNGHTVTVLPGQGPAMSPDDFLSRQPVTPHNVGQALGLEAFNHFHARFPEENSFAEFLLGLRDVGQLIPKLQGGFLNSLASAHLSKEFGWDNLLSDIRVLASACDSVVKRLEFLRRTVGRPVTIHFFRKDVFDTFIPGWSSGPGYRAWGTKIVPTLNSSAFRASATLQHGLGHLDDEIGYWRAMIGHLGLNNPLKALWVNLPYSFVVDWFLDISGHLDRVAAIQPAEQWSVSNISHSWDFRWKFDVFQDSTPVYGSGTDGLIKLLGRVEFRDYTRLPGLPLDWENLSLSSPTPSQLALALAMMVK